jgi:hypothetical protein
MNNNNNKNNNRKGLPLSGSETVFTENKWSTKKGVRHNNCYSYAADNYSNTRVQKAVPGGMIAKRNGKAPNYDAPLSCPNLAPKVVGDNPEAVYRADADAPCKQGYYKIMMFVDPGEGSPWGGDFHFYKQHKDVNYTVHEGDSLSSIARTFRVTVDFLRRHNPGVSDSPRVGSKVFVPNVNAWSHKMGHATGALLTDSCGKIIKDPRRACRSYSHTYKDFCGGFCVKKNGNVKTV